MYLRAQVGGHPTENPLAELQHQVVVLWAVHLVRAGCHGFPVLDVGLAFVGGPQPGLRSKTGVFLTRSPRDESPVFRLAAVGAKWEVF